jgi:hypothetical protein
VQRVLKRLFRLDKRRQNATRERDMKKMTLRGSGKPPSGGRGFRRADFSDDPWLGGSLALPGSCKAI